MRPCWIVPFEHSVAMTDLWRRRCFLLELVVVVKGVRIGGCVRVVVSSVGAFTRRAGEGLGR